MRYSRPFGEVALRVPGRHNVQNALAAIAAADWAGVGREMILLGVSEFTGAARRFQTFGEARGVLVVDDYAHHPTEIRAVLRAARERYPGRELWCLFQPHQNGRTRRLMDDFSRAFGDADRVLISEAFSVREKGQDDAGRELSGRIGGASLYVGSKEEALAFARERIPAGSVLLTLGAGDIGAVAREFIR